MRFGGGFAVSSTPAQMPDWLLRRSITHPRVTAVCTPQGELTYRQLYEKATTLAAGLRILNVEGPVALLAKDPLVVTLALHALIEAGLVVVPLNWRLTPMELAWQVRDAAVSWLLHDDAQAEVATEVTALSDGVRTCAVDAIPQPGVPLCPPYLNLDAVHAVIYTSGTTGHPKGTQITYGNEWYSATMSALQLGVLPTDRWLSPLPLFHVGGMSVLLRSVIYGTTAVLHSGFDAAAANGAIDAGEVSLASMVPTMLQRIIELRQGRPFPPTLRAILLGGSAASQTLLDAARALKAPVAQSYGLTETASQVCTLMPEDFQRKPQSSGLPAVMNEVVVVEQRARTLLDDPLCHRCPPGAPGEIVVRGPTVTPGYLNRPEDTSKAIRSGWLWTGDIGYVDEEGYLFVLDRRHDLIVSGGENIYPAEVESALESYAGIMEAGVVAMADEDWGQIPVAFVVAQPSVKVSESGLKDHCRQLLAGYKVPKAFYLVNQLPRNASGKLMRRILQTWLETENLKRILP